MDNIFIKRILILVSGFMAVVAFTNTVDLAGQSRLKSFEYRNRVAYRYSVQSQNHFNDC